MRWMPVVGERVRMSGLGMEGTLRFIGQTQFKEGVWSGVELEGGFAGKGKNDGSVDG
jgi:dynactin complex subunit